MDNSLLRIIYFCTSVHSLDLSDVRTVMARIEEEAGLDIPLKERSAQAVRLFQAMAEARHISLKLNKKPRSKKEMPTP